MIRPFAILCCLGCAGAGAWLYQVKHQVVTYDRELRDIRRQTEQARDRSAILRAEWALLNEPDRLRQMATRHLPLEAMQPQHFARLAEMERRLPAAVAFAGAPNILAPLDPPRGAAPVLLAVNAAPAAAAARGATPAQQVRGTPDPRAPEAPAPQALAAAVAEQRAARPVNPLPAMPARPAPLRDATPIARPDSMIARTDLSAPRPTPHGAPNVTPRPVQQAQPAEPSSRIFRAPETAMASALGNGTGRPLLAPPVPFSSANAATLQGGGGGVAR